DANYSRERVGQHARTSVRPAPSLLPPARSAGRFFSSPRRSRAAAPAMGRKFYATESASFQHPAYNARMIGVPCPEAVPAPLLGSKSGSTYWGGMVHHPIRFPLKYSTKSRSCGQGFSASSRALARLWRQPCSSPRSASWRAEVSAACSAVLSGTVGMPGSGLVCGLITDLSSVGGGAITPPERDSSRVVTPGDCLESGL